MLSQPWFRLDILTGFTNIVILITVHCTLVSHCFVNCQHHLSHSDKLVCHSSTSIHLHILTDLLCTIFQVTTMQQLDAPQEFQIILFQMKTKFKVIYIFLYYLNQKVLTSQKRSMIILYICLHIINQDREWGAGT